MARAFDIAIPTYGGEEVIEATLDALSATADQSDWRINRLLVDYRPDADATGDVVREWCDRHGVGCEVERTDHTLPEARQALIERVETDWFLFLDDDVCLRPETLSRLVDSISPLTGAVQVRKARQADGDNAAWSKWRPVRGTTFATLVRTDAVDGIDIPDEITVLEDEYLRQYVENERGYLWTFNHQAVVDHDNQGRHAIDTREGILAGRYGLLPSDYVLLNVPYNVVTLNQPVRHAKRALGFCYGVATR